MLKAYKIYLNIVYHVEKHYWILLPRTPTTTPSLKKSDQEDMTGGRTRDHRTKRTNHKRTRTSTDEGLD